MNMEQLWKTEPKRTAFEHAGFPCITLRERTHRCGYVGVPPGHPWHGKDDTTMYGRYDWENDGKREEPTWLVPEVHGGVTYGRACDGDPIGGVCHKAACGEPDDVWWIGFDCAHSGDFVPPEPAMHARHPELFRMEPRHGDVFRDLAYVEAECRSLAEQARAALSASSPSGAPQDG